MEIGWRPVTITLSGNVINLQGSVIIPFRDKFKIRQIIKSRPLLLHLMLKQGQTWYPLSGVREMMEIENNVPQINRYAYRILSNHEIMNKKRDFYFINNNEDIYIILRWQKR